MQLSCVIVGLACMQQQFLTAQKTTSVKSLRRLLLAWKTAFSPSSWMAVYTALFTSGIHNWLYTSVSAMWQCGMSSLPAYNLCSYNRRLRRLYNRLSCMLSYMTDSTLSFLATAASERASWHTSSWLDSWLSLTGCSLQYKWYRAVDGRLFTRQIRAEFSHCIAPPSLTYVAEYAVIITMML